MSADQNRRSKSPLEAPVVVRVELGAVEMMARESPGRARGRATSSACSESWRAAILRIAGHEVARVSFVQVDGEYGIRITSTTPRAFEGSMNNTVFCTLLGAALLATGCEDDRNMMHTPAPFIPSLHPAPVTSGGHVCPRRAS